LMDPSDRKKKYIDDLYMTTNLESWIPTNILAAR
jgi:hypothetical protein